MCVEIRRACIEDVSDVKRATWNPDDRCNVDVVYVISDEFEFRTVWDRDEILRRGSCNVLINVLISCNDEN